MQFRYVHAHSVLGSISCLFLAALTVPAFRPASSHAAGQAPTSQDVQWRAGVQALPDMAVADVARALTALSERADARHVIVRLSKPVELMDRQALNNAGLQLLAFLGNNAFFAVTDAGGLDADALVRGGLVVHAAPIEREQRLHPFLLAGQVPEWAVVSSAARDGKGGDAIVGAYVIFHSDVPLVPDAVGIARRYGATVRSHLGTVNGLVIELPFDRIDDLADNDAVQWVEPPLPRFSEKNDSNRVITGANVVQAAPYGLDGSGVTVLVYDGGVALQSHQDFGGRLTARDSSGLSDHSTHVAGTVGGSGAGSGGQYRGMAPGVTIESYGYEYDGSGIFLYTNPGDMLDDYAEAMNVYGADISNNSIGTNTCWNGFPCSITGDYGVTSAVIDSIVQGDLGEPMRIVWANGNERSCTSCPSEHNNGFHSTAPPGCAKNQLSVGALNSNDDSQTVFTSWGPCDDGRLKPDVSAPGCQSNGDGAVTSCSSSGGYTGKCGTSMAAPTVCGLGALLLQDYRVQYPGERDFRNSTLRAILAHTAVDRGNAGPDYSYGYGSVRIEPAIELVRDGNFLEDQVAQLDRYNLLIVVGPSDTELKVTLVWDDPPGTPNVDVALVNDLDLVVYSPSSVRHYPWTLDPGNPSVPAVRTRADHINNIEQVYVANPEPGAWRVEVLAFDVPVGPQVFSVTATPTLVNCSTQGIISLDRPKYACEGEAVIQVVDCDLNTDDGVVETIQVPIVSSSEPGGEMMTLTETAAETAVFLGTITLSTTDAPGVLQIADGDTITATYVDADDGIGGIDVVVEGTASVDCQAPVISNVATSNIGPRDATVTFDTDEAASGSVRYGLSCGALTETSSAAGFQTRHEVRLTGLSDDTGYFFAIDAEDEAGNATTDDDGGTCHRFATPDIPDFFTEPFGSGIDLVDTTLLFVPNGNFDYYASCVEAIDTLPVDPTGGTVVSLSDDSSQVVNLGGETITLYGTSYSSFYVGSNGYVTFGSGDSDYTESLAEHFAMPRISGLYDDLNPSTGGTVSYLLLADRAVVTWQNVPEYSTSNSNTFQIEMLYAGNIRISYGGLDSGDAIIGLSAGDGLSPDYLDSDLSAAGNCGPRPPTAQNMEVETEPNLPVNIVLDATDDGLPDPPGALTYTVLSLPTNGTLADADAGQIGSVPYALANNGSEVIYSPSAFYGGLDAFDFSADDGGVAPEGGASNMATVSITVGVPGVVYSFPMDVDPGWTMDALWQFGQPTGGGSNNGDPSSGFTGTNVLGYNLDGDYTNNMAVVYATTTAINCTGLSETELRFRRWLGVEAATADHATVEVSNDGTNWTTVWTHSGGSVSESSWSAQAFDISGVADGQPTLYVRWSMGPTNASATYPGWNIDDVEIWARHPQGDCNENGILDSVDIADGTSSDVNGNGIPDECELFAPLTANPPLDEPRNRYLSFSPNNGANAVAFHVTLPDGREGWVGEPIQQDWGGNDPVALSLVVDAPVVRAWPESDVFVHGCVVMPDRSYEIRTSDGGAIVTNPLIVGTVPAPEIGSWADIVGVFDEGSQSWTSPNGVVNFRDVSAAVGKFQESPTAPHVTMVDLHPQWPNYVVNFSDIGMVIRGFQNVPYPVPVDDCPTIANCPLGGEAPCLP